MNLNHKVQKQKNFLPGKSRPDFVVNRPIELSRNVRHQTLGQSNASGERELRIINETT